MTLSMWCPHCAPIPIGIRVQIVACTAHEWVGLGRYDGLEAAVDLLVRILRVVVPLGAVAQLDEWGRRYVDAVHEIRELHAVYSCECKPSTWCLYCQIAPHLEVLP